LFFAPKLDTLLNQDGDEHDEDDEDDEEQALKIAEPFFQSIEGKVHGRMVVLQLCPMRCITARCGGDDIYHCMLSMLKQSGDETSHVRCCWAPDAVCGPDTVNLRTDMIARSRSFVTLPCHYD